MRKFIIYLITVFRRLLYGKIVIKEIAGIKLRRIYQLDAPTGVRGRCSDNTLIQRKLGWSPSISLQTGMEKTYSLEVGTRIGGMLTIVMLFIGISYFL